MTLESFYVISFSLCLKTIRERSKHVAKLNTLGCPLSKADRGPTKVLCFTSISNLQCRRSSSCLLAGKQQWRSECWYDVYIQKVKLAAGVRQIPGRSYNTISGMSHTRWGWSLFLSHPIIRKTADKLQTIAKILWFWRSWQQFCFSKRLVSPGVRRQRSQSLERARCSSVLTITNNHINILNLWHLVWDWLSHENFNPMSFTPK